MRSSAMARAGFLLLLLSLSAVCGQSGWEVIYSRLSICTVRGWTVHIRCSYKTPAGKNLQKLFWIKETQGDTSGRVNNDITMSSKRFNNTCNSKTCTLTIRKTKESDSAVYKLRFLPNSNTGQYTGEPGVNLTVSKPCLNITVEKSSDLKPDRLSCYSTCSLTGQPTYVWYRYDQTVGYGKTFDLQNIKPGHTYKCHVPASRVCSTPVGFPTPPTVSTDPSHIILEGDQVNLTCRSDAYPPATYSWFKRNLTLHHYLPELIIQSVQSSHSGEYSCSAENLLGESTRSILIDVKYGPKSPFVSVTGESVEGSSVTLNCNSDANPKAKYTWHRKSHGWAEVAGQNFTITDIKEEDSGYYYCEAWNSIGRIKSDSQLITLAVNLGTMNIIRLTLLVLLLPALLIFILRNSRKKTTRSSYRKPQADKEMIEMDASVVYENVSETVAGASANRSPVRLKDDGVGSH